MDPRSTVPSAAATSDDLQSSGGISSSSSSPANAVARISHPLSQRQQHLLDKTVPHVLYRWISCLAVVLVYAVPVYFMEGFYIITYSIGIYILSLLIAFHSPQEDLEASIGGGGLPTRRSDEFRPFIRRLPEFKFWFVCFPLNYDPSVYCILVMRDGMIVQSGKYDELVSSGLDFVELVAAHETSMELVEASSTSAAAANVPTQRSISIEPPRHPHRRVSIESPRHQPTTPNSPIINRTTSMESPRMQRTTSMESPCLGELNDESIKSFLGANIPEDGSRLIKEEERAVGQVSFQVYKLYLTEAYGWWGIILVLFFSLAWQGSIMASDYWLPYETSAKREVSFDASVFIRIYLIIAAISIVLVCCRAFYITHLGLKTSQIFLPLNLS